MFNKLTILTPYFPSKSNQYGGIFVFDQVIEMSNKVDKIDVFVIRPLFYISRKFPFIRFNKENSIFRETKKDNISIFELKYFPFPKDTLFYHKSISFSLFLSRKKFSKNILTHTIYPLGVAVENIGLKPTVVVHGSDLRYFIKNKKQKKAIIKSFNNIKNIITVSEGLKKEIIDLGINPNKITTINNGIKLTFNDTDENKSNRNKFRFVFVGSLIIQKGVYELLEAFIKLKEKNKNVELYFIGDGIEKNKLIQKSSKYKESIFFTGSLSNNEVMKKLQEMDCLVLPSYKEGFGRVIIEMMSFGKPVISTYSGGPEFIINKENGLLVHPKNIEELEKAMHTMIKNYNSYDSKKIKQYCIDNYNLEKQTKKLLNIIYKGTK